MMNDLLIEVRSTPRHWWTLLIRGIVAILFGLAALFIPKITLLFLVLLFGAFVLIDGIGAIMIALQERKATPNWWLPLVGGIVGVVIGIVTFFWPHITAFILLYLIAIWAILTGITELVTAFAMRGATALEWTLAIAGAISIVFGLLLIIFPRGGILAVLWIVGIYAIVFGIVLVIRAFQLRSVVSMST
ncbi:MAG TPA: HdeD family acid-resistance protein [Ktedonobacteraceae bacterium]|jgi:uncharacterized membrane protein HdeD (DUF308 family)